MSTPGRVITRDPCDDPLRAPGVGPTLRCRAQVRLRRLPPQLTQKPKLERADAQELLHLRLGRDVRFQVVRRQRCGDRVLTLGGDEQDSALEPRDQAQEQIEKYEGIRIPDRDGDVDRDPQSDETDEDRDGTSTTPSSRATGPRLARRASACRRVACASCEQGVTVGRRSSTSAPSAQPRGWTIR